MRDAGRRKREKGSESEDVMPLLSLLFLRTGGSEFYAGLLDVTRVSSAFRSWAPPSQQTDEKSSARPPNHQNEQSRKLNTIHNKQSPKEQRE